jgi:hypothetical protein
MSGVRLPAAIKIVDARSDFAPPFDFHRPLPRTLLAINRTMKPIIVLPYCEQNAQTAELLLSWIYRLNYKEQRGTILLIASHDCHPEIQWRTRVSAEEFFTNVEQVVAKELSPGNKTYRVNQTMKFASQFIQANYRTPWIWLEPDCVPLTNDWLERLELAYNAQPKKYLAPQQIWNRDKAEVAISRIAVYPHNSWGDLSKLCDTNQPFERYGGKALLDKSTKTQLIQNLPEYTKVEDVKSDAVLLHRDKTGALIRYLRAKSDNQILQGSI